VIKIIANQCTHLRISFSRNFSW